MSSEESKPIENISTGSKDFRRDPPPTNPLKIAENFPECVPVAGCNIQGNDSSPVKFVTEESDVGRDAVTNHYNFSLSKPGQTLCFQPMEQPFHKPRIQIVPTENHALNNPGTGRDIIRSTSQQQMFPTCNKEMLSDPKGYRAAQASAKGTQSASHEAVAANGTIEGEIAGCSRVSHDAPHSSSPK